MFDVTGRKQYGTNLVHLIKDLRSEFKSPEMKVVVGVMGVNGPHNEHNPKQKDVREGQRFINGVPEFKGNARAIETAPLLDPRVVALTAGGWLPEYDRFQEGSNHRERKGDVGLGDVQQGFSLQWRRPVLHSGRQGLCRNHACAIGCRRVVGPNAPNNPKAGCQKNSIWK